MTDLPIDDGDDTLRVEWLEITSARADGTVTYRGASSLASTSTAATSPKSLTAPAPAGRSRTRPSTSSSSTAASDSPQERCPQHSPLRAL